MSIAMNALAQLPLSYADSPTDRISKVKAGRRIVVKRDLDQTPELP